jgi:sugar lactone lactonase YvrE
MEETVKFARKRAPLGLAALLLSALDPSTLHQGGHSLTIVQSWLRAANGMSRSALTGEETIITVAGTGVQGSGGEGGPAVSAQLDEPTGLTVDSNGNLLIADKYNHAIRKIAVGSGEITRLAGRLRIHGRDGDGGPATNARLDSPTSVAVDAAGNIFIADQRNHQVRKVAAGTRIITTVAGTGIAGFAGDGGPATGASLNNPTGVAIDRFGNLYIADQDNHVIRRVAAGEGTITTAAGTGVGGFEGEGVLATSARLKQPTGVAIHENGNLFIADRSNHRIRRVEAGTAKITTVAGTQISGFDGDGGPATSAKLNHPSGVAVDRTGHILYIADQINDRIRQVDLRTGTITTVAGNGDRGFGGDGEPASRAKLNLPIGVAIDSSGNLYIADQLGHRVRKVVRAPPPMPTPPQSGPTIHRPGQDATVDAGSATKISWTPVPGAQTYFFEYSGPMDRANSFTVAITPESASEPSLEVRIDPATSPGTYRFRITALDASGRPISMPSDFRTVMVRAPTTPTPTAPLPPTAAPIPVPIPTPSGNGD